MCLKSNLEADTAPYNVLAGAIAVGVMVLPMIASLSEDALRAVPRSLRESSLWARRDKARSVDASRDAGGALGHRLGGHPRDLARRSARR